MPEGRRVFAPLTVAENLRMGAYTAAKATTSGPSTIVYEMFPILSDRARAPPGCSAAASSRCSRSAAP